MILSMTMAIVLLIVLLVMWDNKLIKERQSRKAIEAELTTLTERLYGNRETYERVKVNTTRAHTPREQKVALECAKKGIPRANKMYPARFKSTRRAR